MDYTLIRSNRRSLALEVTRDAEIIVRSPKRCPRREIERFIESHADWIARHMERQKRRREAHPEPTEAERVKFIALAKTELPKRIARYAERMGLFPTGVRVTGAKKRFGSCSPQNSLCFSWRLMQYPDEAIDYVVVHELAHIVHRNHGARFYALVASVLPDYKTRQKMLKE
jgi:predicted metal-dependent hydrolase